MKNLFFIFILFFIGINCSACEISIMTEVGQNQKSELIKNLKIQIIELQEQNKTLGNFFDESDEENKKKDEVLNTYKEYFIVCRDKDESYKCLLKKQDGLLLLMKKEREWNKEELGQKRRQLQEVKKEMEYKSVLLQLQQKIAKKREVLIQSTQKKLEQMQEEKELLLDQLKEQELSKYDHLLLQDNFKEKEFKKKSNSKVNWLFVTGSCIAIVIIIATYIPKMVDNYVLSSLFPVMSTNSFCRFMNIRYPIFK